MVRFSVASLGVFLWTASAFASTAPLSVSCREFLKEQGRSSHHIDVRAAALPELVVQEFEFAATAGAVVRVASSRWTERPDTELLVAIVAAAEGVRGHAYVVFDQRMVLVDEEEEHGVDFLGQCRVLRRPREVAPFVHAFAASWAEATQTEGARPPRYRIGLDVDAYTAFRWGGSGRRLGGTAVQPSIAPRYYDVHDGDMVLNAAELKAQFDTSHVSAFVGIGAGSWFEQNTASETILRQISEAYVVFRPKTAGSMAFEAGKFFTHVGLETARAFDNANYSRSFLYGYALPFWHTGIRGRAKVSDEVAVLLALYNMSGAAAYPDNNKDKSVGVGLAYAPTSRVTVNYGAIVGREADDSQGPVRISHDVNALWHASEELELAFDCAVVHELTVGGGTHWFAAEAFARFLLTAKYAVTLRGEAFFDRTGGAFARGPGRLGAATLTHSWALDPALELRFESRYDVGNRSYFVRGTAPATSQLTGSLALLARL